MSSYIKASFSVWHFYDAFTASSDEWERERWTGSDTLRRRVGKLRTGDGALSFRAFFLHFYTCEDRHSQCAPVAFDPDHPRAEPQPFPMDLHCFKFFSTIADTVPVSRYRWWNDSVWKTHCILRSINVFFLHTCFFQVNKSGQTTTPSVLHVLAHLRENPVYFQSQVTILQTCSLLSL